MESWLSALPHVIIMSAEFITGIIVNGFLVIVNCSEFIKGRKLTSIQLLLICIGMSRFGLLIILMLQSLFSVFFPFFYRTKIYGASMIFFWMFFNSVSVWFTTCLSVFYCLKISGFTQSYFLWLKFRTTKLMPWLLLGSLVSSVSMAALCHEVGYPKNVNDDVLRNATRRKTEVMVKQVNDMLLVNLALLVPLAIFVMCTVTLFISLYKHTHRMKMRAQELRNASTEAHINALRTVVTFFCFFISYFAAFMTNMTFGIPYQSQQFFVLKDIMAAYPSGHSVIIVLSNSKLQQPFRRILCFQRN
ncbi:PREDICTED: taste receptor type 2 member 7-like [Elephantulus edwardii]|uniref:taste receptor type 2 member 7-like n=1 Tax=Elephantulus edwardii TaxID=28737 RepID=UPI0003F0D9AE|nr:PREDICTED: taste receptor type 2 member 7-like [Elephantulus edwardii]